VKPHFSTPLIALNPVVIDTETNGLDVTNARIIQLGAVCIADGQVRHDAVLEFLVNPNEPIPAATTAIHGISDQMVADADPFGVVAAPFVKFIGDAAILGHNVGFDLAMLTREFSLAGMDWVTPPFLDTMSLARIVNPVLPNYSLDLVAEWLNIDIENRHSALGDATATAHVFLALIPRLRKAGIRTIADAQRASVALSQRLSEQAQYAPDLNTTGLTDLTESTSAIRRIDSFPFQYRVKDVMSSPALIVESDRTPAQLATLLSNRKTSAVFVDLSGNGSAYGIVTERDLMRLLCNNDTADAATAGEIASASLRTIGQDAFIYQALGEMHAASIRHLGVKDEAGMLVGALTSGDLLRQRADDAMFLHGDLEGASNVGSLAEIWGRLPLVARSLLDEGIDASHIAAVLGEQLATMTRRAAQLAETRLREDGKGGPPAPYCVLLLGSGGRGETLLAPDQDNAIVFANGYDFAEPWFAELGGIMADILDEVGIPYCKGGVMASNAEWCHDLESWKNTVHEWLSRADWRDQCYVDIFYDFCPVHGDRVLARELWDYAYSLAGKAPGFIRQLSAMATSFGAPLGFFGGLRTENGRLDLKGGGTMPIVSGARVLALRHDIRERGTRQRLLGVKELGVVNGDDIENVISAHEILLQNILEQQLLDLAAGIAPSNKIDAKRLTKRRRQELKEALEKVAVIQTAVGDPMAFG
jgi:DNA polymerase-3 subunit epsilon/CBS domain-containing protein